MTSWTDRSTMSTGDGTTSLRLPDGFTDVFTSRLVELNGLRLHAVTGGDGPPLLSVGGWPQNLVRLAGSDARARPRATPSSPVDLARGRALRQARRRLRRRHDGRRSGRADGRARARPVRRGRPRHRHVDGYALAADHTERVGRLAVVEAVIPRVSCRPRRSSARPRSTRSSGSSASTGSPTSTRKLVRGRERLFFGWQFATKAATPTAIPAYAVDVYVDAIAEDPRALRASFAYYRGGGLGGELPADEEPLPPLGPVPR